MFSMHAWAFHYKTINASNQDTGPSEFNVLIGRSVKNEWKTCTWKFHYSTGWCVADQGSIQRLFQRKIEDTKGIIRSRKSMKDRQHNGQKDKQWSTKHYREN